MPEEESEKNTKERSVPYADTTADKTLFFTDDLVEKYFGCKGYSCTNRVNDPKKRNAFNHLKRWTAGNNVLTADRLREWRKSLEEGGYSKSSIQTYVKMINNFLRWAGCEELCIPKPLRHDLSGQVFGYLTAVEPTSKRHRKDIVWSCICKCGNKVEVPATFLRCAVTTSCGCAKAEHLMYVNQLVEDTSLRRVLKDDAVSDIAMSGYTGVTFRYGKWTATIEYKKKRYFLGNYEKLEDAVSARADAKARIMEDAQQLEEQYHTFFEEKPVRFISAVSEKEEISPSVIQTKRNDNTSGYPGVSRKRNRWTAKINYKGERYHLGVYETIEEAAAIRKEAEACIAVCDIEKLKKLCKGQEGK